MSTATPPVADLPTAVIGVLGGSGLYAMDGLSDVEELVLETPYGTPSDALVRGRIGEATVVFLHLAIIMLRSMGMVMNGLQRLPRLPVERDIR